MRILVTGAAGAVGSYVPRVFTADELTLTDRRGDFRFLDVRDFEAVKATVADVKPDLVLHLAAATDVDECERNPDYAHSNNSVGTQNVALAVRDAGCELVYISTAGVFWGDKPDPYDEFDVPRPANVYGVSKLAGERTVMSLLDRWYVVRAGWMVGGGALDHKFVGKIAEQIRSGQTHLKAVDDKFGSPTYAPDLLGVIQAVVAGGRHGLYHGVNRGMCSRFDVAVEITRILDREEVDVEPVSSAFFPLAAPRARSEAMRNYMLELHGLHETRPWQDALHEYVTQEVMPALEARASATA